MTGRGRDPELTLVKLGGSLITDKRRRDTPRLDTIRALARQLARASNDGARVVVGHGSGSFGHPAALDAGLVGADAGADAEPVDAPATAPGPAGIARVQARAAALHRLVLDALTDAGAAPFSIPPSAVAVARDGAIHAFDARTALAALEAGLLPVVYGDVVLDTVRGASIASTETVLGALAGELRAAGWRIRRCLWLGTTEGVERPDGVVVDRVSVGQADRLLQVAGGAGAPDVTGGMRHRVAAALSLARAGVPSWIGNGDEPAALERLLAGETLPGTLVVP